MSDFERRIRAMPWRNSPEGLQEKIFGPALESPSLQLPTCENHGRMMSVRLSLACAMTAACVGFVAGMVLTPNESRTTVASRGTDIRVVEVSSSRNSFDFSVGAAQILPGEFTAYIDDEPESTQ